MELLANFINLLTQALVIAIVLRAILSWFVPEGDHPVVRILRDVTDPLIVPLRRVIPSIGMLESLAICGDHPATGGPQYCDCDPCPEPVVSRGNILTSAITEQPLVEQDGAVRPLVCWQ